MKQRFKGQGVIAGIGVGKILRANENLDKYLKSYIPSFVEEEKEKVDKALKDVQEYLFTRAEALRRDGLTEQGAILEAHALIVADPVMRENVLSKIDATGNSLRAVLNAAEDQAAVFESMEDEYFRARAVDFRDVGKRIARAIIGVPEREIGDEAVILCGHEIEPSYIANLKKGQIAGILLGAGSTTAHAVIIAKAQAIPAIVGAEEAVAAILDGEEALMDGETGEIITGPTDEERAAYEEKAKKAAAMRAHYIKLKDLPSVTEDGRKVILAANIGVPGDMETAIEYGAEGVGLFRTEFLFMGRETLPGEEEQFAAYKDVAEKAKGKLTIIRTMDIGGDKPLSYLEIPKEDNPFLGYRALRVSLKRKDLFLPQLKAALRAGLYGKVAVMFPMIISVQEFLKAKEFVEEAKHELTKEKKEFKDAPLGIMVETPAAAMTADSLAKYADFFSIGSNDLVQYTLAVDRSNSEISHLYNHFHPAVLKLVQHTIGAAKEHGIMAGMCGEMASDPRAAVLLLAMGIDELSMSAPSIPEVKERVRSVTMDEAKELLRKALSFEDGESVKHYLEGQI
ncbi:MAG: phosphoenolpyruvate--protein phosphotransferase [Selenomonadaceae bacterium]|nr:phosphoenolpyruvate--protein phosphotransferase [Selenomonadaceae bacterium]